MVSFIMLHLCSRQLPVDIVFHPSWWHKNAGISFDESFFYDPRRRVEDERKMEQVLYDRFGDLGLGEDHLKDLPQIGAVHLASGYLLSEMLGCKIEYYEDAPPQVICAHKDTLDFEVEDAFRSPAFKRLVNLIEQLKAKHGYVVGDINWGGVLNLAIDVRGEEIFTDMLVRPEETEIYFKKIAQVIDKFVWYVQANTGSSSISVNRSARLFDYPVAIHSECSHTMISEEDYRRFLLPIDQEWSMRHAPYGIHYCGKDPHRMAEAFSEIERLTFLDVGWGGDVALLRKYLPNTFFNIRLNPVDIQKYTYDELERNIRERVVASGPDLTLTGICCVNMDKDVTDERIREIYKVASDPLPPQGGTFNSSADKNTANKTNKDLPLGGNEGVGGLDSFDFTLADSQATAVTPIEPADFGVNEYADYADALDERCDKFWKADQGVLVYRRMRVKEVFAQDSRSMEKSLRWQLGALKESMKFKADIPNFLEPWHGLGTVASAYGFGYLWEEGQAPAVDGKFRSVQELIDAPYKAVKDTEIGRYTLEMTRYFKEQTQGRIPMSFCDVQSPLNTLSNIIDSNQFYLDFYDNPEAMQIAMNRTADLLIDYTREQQLIIGDALARPGHGFASSRKFTGIGMSDDTVTMMPDDIYFDVCAPAMARVGNEFGGAVFHSCGNWSSKKAGIVQIPGIKMADGAFSLATDPGANPTDGYAETFANTNVILNARIVGNPQLVLEKVKQLWRPGMKLIVVTYAETPEEQAYLYDEIHKLCSK